MKGRCFEKVPLKGHAGFSVNMAPLLFRDMKGVSFSCASPASAAICTSIDKRSMVRPSTTKAVDRYAFHSRDTRRAKTLSPLSQPPSKPKSYNHKSRRSSEKPVNLISPANSSRCLLEDSSAIFDVLPDRESLPALVPTEPSRFLTLKADGSAVLRPSSSTKAVFGSSEAVPVLFPVETPRFQTTRKDGSATPRLSSATRDIIPVLIPTENSMLQTSETDKSPTLRPSSSTKQQDQIVVLRVSLHCKGCEGKVRKHISKMEGVTSFSIDLASKKVIVIGDVTPLSVLNSISKVKNAQFWQSPPRASASF